MTNPLFDNLFGAHAESDDPFLFLLNGQIITYKKFLALSAKIANAFFDLGLMPGDCVAIQVQKSPEMLNIYAACAQAGLVFLPLNPSYTVDELEYFIENSEARLIICDEANKSVRDGYNIIILSDRLSDNKRQAIPALLACSATHQYLVKAGNRTNTGLVIDTGSAREVHHFALLAGYGAEAVCPWLTFETIHSLTNDFGSAQEKFIKAIGKGLYKGTCRERIVSISKPHSLRVRLDDRLIKFKDLTKGLIMGRADQLFGDFVARRPDGYHSYHLATIVDDSDAGVTEIIRGDDLLQSTFPQLWLYKKLGIKIPNYSHILTVKDASGVKLSKQTGAEVVTPNMAAYALSTSLELLGIPVPKSMEGDKPSNLLKWGLSRWKAYQSR